MLVSILGLPGSGSMIRATPTHCTCSAGCLTRSVDRTGGSVGSAARARRCPPGMASISSPFRSSARDGPSDREPSGPVELPARQWSARPTVAALAGVARDGDSRSAEGDDRSHVDAGTGGRVAAAKRPLGEPPRLDAAQAGRRVSAQGRDPASRPAPAPGVRRGRRRDARSPSGPRVPTAPRADAAPRRRAASTPGRRRGRDG